MLCCATIHCSWCENRKKKTAFPTPILFYYRCTGERTPGAYVTVVGTCSCLQSNSTISLSLCFRFLDYVWLLSWTLLRFFPSGAPHGSPLCDVRSFGDRCMWHWLLRRRPRTESRHMGAAVAHAPTKDPRLTQDSHNREPALHFFCVSSSTTCLLWLPFSTHFSFGTCLVLLDQACDGVPLPSSCSLPLVTQFPG